MDKAKVVKVSDEIRDALKEIAARHGLRLKQGNVRYGDFGFRETIELLDPAAKSREAMAFEASADLHGLKPSDLGTKVKFGAETYEIVGLKLRACRKPIMLRRVRDGQGVVTTVDTILAAQRIANATP